MRPALRRATALSGTTRRPGTAGPIECTAFKVSTPQATSLHRETMIDRTPLLRFLSPSALARHVALVPDDAIAPAIPLRPLTDSRHLLRLRDASAASCTHAWAASVCPCGFSRFMRELARPTLRGSKPRVLIGTLRRSRRVAASIRVAPPLVMRRRLSAAGVPLPAVRVTWPGRAPFGVEAFVFSVP